MLIEIIVLLFELKNGDTFKSIAVLDKRIFKSNN